MIIPCFKKVGETTLKALERCANKVKAPGKRSFAGRLDPMADGIFLALLGKDRFKKEKLNKLDKEYELEILFGVCTDTGDILGLLKSAKGFNCNTVKNEDIKRAVKKFEKKIVWRYPCFSSKTYKGKQLFKYALEGRCPEDRPKYKGEIYKIKFVGAKLLNKEELKEKIFYKLHNLQNSSVKENYKDFRIANAQDSWRNFFENTKQLNFCVIKLNVIVSKSVYMRTLTEKIGEELGSCALAFHIRRKSFGKFLKILPKIKGFWLKYYAIK